MIFPEADGYPAFSPDGKWVAYNSGEHIFVRRFPNTGEQWQVTPESGQEPKWSRDGKTIFYTASGGTVTAVPVKLGDTFEAGPPQRLFRCDGFVAPSADGQRFLVIMNEDSRRDPVLQVVLNWREMVEKK
jgi:WD40 repeat protein